MSDQEHDQERAATGSEDEFKDTSFLCGECYEDDRRGTFSLSCGHHDQPVWGVAEAKTGDDESAVIWLVSGLTYDEAEAEAERMRSASEG